MWWFLFLLFVFQILTYTSQMICKPAIWAIARRYRSKGCEYLENDSCRKAFVVFRTFLCHRFGSIDLTSGWFKPGTNSWVSLTSSLGFLLPSGAYHFFRQTGFWREVVKWRILLLSHQLCITSFFLGRNRYPSPASVRWKRFIQNFQLWAYPQIALKFWICLFYVDW